MCLYSIFFLQDVLNQPSKVNLGFLLRFGFFPSNSHKLIAFARLTLDLIELMLFLQLQPVEALRGTIDRTRKK